MVRKVAVRQGRPMRSSRPALRVAPLSAGVLFDYLFVLLFVFSVSQAGYYPSSGLNLSAMTAAKESGQHGLFGYVGTACTLFSLVIAAKDGVRLRFAPSSVLILLGGLTAMLISSAWSAVPVANAVNGLKSLAEITAIYVVAVRLGERRFVNAFALAVILIGAGSLFLIFTSRDFSVSASDFVLTETVQGWRGMFQTKNALASFGLFSFAILIFFFPETHRTVLYKAAIVFALVLLVGSVGKTARIAGLAMVAWIGAAQIVYRLTGTRKSLIFLALAAVALTPLAFVVLPHASSGEITFTGRLKIWQFYLAAASSHLMLGYGGAAAADPDLSMDAFRTLGQMSAHNSFIAVLTDVGLPGLLLYVLWLLSAAVAFTRQASNYRCFAGLATLIGFMASAMMEASASFVATLPIVALLIQCSFSGRGLTAESPRMVQRRRFIGTAQRNGVGQGRPA